MQQKLIESIKAKIKFLEENKEKLIIDSDTHLTDIDNLPADLKYKYENTDNYYHGKPIGIQEILADMNLASVDMCLVWQNPATTKYTNDKKENFKSLLDANRYIFEITEKYPNRFIPAGWIDPLALEFEDALKLATICVSEFGFPFVKMNPAQNSYMIDSPEVLKAVQYIVELGATPAFHFGADTPFTPLSGLLNVVKQFPDNSIVAVHMGGGGSGYVEAEELYNNTRFEGLKHPNLKFIQSAKRDTHMESDFIAYELAGEPFNTNIMCASDTPYGKMTWNFGGFRGMFKSMESASHPDKRLKANPGLFNEKVAQRYMGGNMADLAIKSYKSILAS